MTNEHKENNELHPGDRYHQQLNKSFQQGYEKGYEKGLEEGKRDAFWNSESGNSLDLSNIIWINIVFPCVE
jgi:flagellar biosynthesis/type III secretory pathway protein FliH